MFRSLSLPSGDASGALEEAAAYWTSLGLDVQPDAGSDLRVELEYGDGHARWNENALDLVVWVDTDCFAPPGSVGG